jgi:CBS domain-containing protein
MTVGSVMSRTVHTCAPGDDPRAALTAMRTYQIRRLPVVGEAGHLVGIVTLADLTRGLGAADAVSSAGVVNTLLGVLTPPGEVIGRAE